MYILSQKLRFAFSKVTKHRVVRRTWLYGCTTFRVLSFSNHCDEKNSKYVTFLTVSPHTLTYTHRHAKPTCWKVQIVESYIHFLLLKMLSIMVYLPLCVIKIQKTSCVFASLKPRNDELLWNRLILMQVLVVRRLKLHIALYKLIVTAFHTLIKDWIHHLWQK